MTNVELNETYSAAEPIKRKRRGPFAEAFYRLSKSPLAMFGMVVIFILVFLAIFADVLAPYS